MTKIAIFLSGRGSNFVAIEKAIKDGQISKASIKCVFSNKDNAPGIAYAQEKGIKTYFVNPKLYINKEDYDKSILKILNSEEIDLICLAGYMKIVSKVIVDKYYGRIMNIHPSLLPAFPGLDAQKQALDYGVRLTGCTVHFVDGGMDTGPIILQSMVPVYQTDTVNTLSDRILEREHVIYPKAVKLFTEGRLKISGRTVFIED